MQQFKTLDGKDWIIKINIAAVRRVRDLVNVDLTAMLDNGMRPLGELLGDPVKFIDVLFVLVMDQAREYGISDVQFGEQMAGDVIEEAAQKFVQEVLDFFPNSKMRVAGKEVIAKSRELMDEIARESLEKIRQIDVKNEAKKWLNSLTN